MQIPALFFHSGRAPEKGGRVSGGLGERVVVHHVVDVAEDKARGCRCRGLSLPIGQGRDGSVVEVDVVGGW